MEVKDIRAFLAVVQEGSINKAAQLLHIAQPPLSRQIKALEDKLGVQLLIRGSKEIQLTEEGHIFVERSKEILELLVNTCQELSTFANNAAGILNIGFVSSLGTSLLPGIIANFRRTHPNVQFKLWEGGSLRIIELIDKGIIDIGFIRPPFNDDKYNILSQKKEPLCAVFNKNFFELPAFATVCISTLQGIPILSIPRYTSILEIAFSKFDTRPHIIAHSDTIVPSLALAEVGLGIAIVPFSAYTSTQLQNKDMLPLFFDDPSLQTAQIIIWKKRRYMSSICTGFIREIRQVMDS